MCPACGSDDVMAVVLVDGEPPAGFVHTVQFVSEDTPAYGCCTCGTTWGVWTYEHT